MEPAIIWQEVITESQKESGKLIDTQKVGGRAFECGGFYWFGATQDSASTGDTGEEGQSASCPSTFLSEQIFTPASDSQVFIGKQIGRDLVKTNK